MSRGAKAIAGVFVLAAVASIGWWLLGMRDDSAAREPLRAATTSSTAGDAMRPDAASESPVPESLVVANSAAAAAAPAQPGTAVAFTGRVVDASGRVVVGAIVHHLPTYWQQKMLGVSFGAVAQPANLDKLAHARTGNDGRFSLPVVDHAPDHAAGRNSGEDWTGSWDDVPCLLVLHPAFETHVVSCVGWRGGAFDAGDIVLAPGVALNGRAVDERGLPLAGVSVAAPDFDVSEDGARRWEWRLVSATVHATTGDDGRFVLEGFWPGPHRLELRAPGRRSVVRGFSGQAGTPLDLGDVVLEPGGVIEGLVADAQGQPIPGARVLARPAEMVELTSMEKQIGVPPDDIAGQFTRRMGDADSVVDVDTLTDANGAFRFDSLDPNSAPFCIYAGKNGFEPVRVDDVALDVPALRLQLGAVASLLLSVVDPESHEAIADAKVTAKRSGRFGDPGLPLAVAAGAELRAAGVEPPHAGLFLLMQAGSARNTAVVSAPGRATQSFELPAVQPGERHSVTVELPRAARVAGRVLDVRQEPIADAMVTLGLADPPHSIVDAARPRRATSDAEGCFAFEGLPAGDVVVRASASGFVAAALPLAVKAATPIEDVELVLQQAGAIAGVVLQGDQPVARARVQAVSVVQAEAVRAAEQAHGGSVSGEDRPPRDVHDVVADAQGCFRIDGLTPEAFEITSHPGALAVAEVKAGETTEVTLVHRARPRVRGHVSDARGPVAGAEIRWESRVAALKGWLNSGVVDGFSDADGNFDLELGEPGHYRIGAKTGHAWAPMVELDADWDQVQWVELKLEKAK